MSLGAPEIIIIAIVIFALFGYKKLPDATRAVGRSLRIFKGEMKGLKEDDVQTRAPAQTVRAPLESPAPIINQVPPVAAEQPAAQPAPYRRPSEDSAARATSPTISNDPAAPPAL